MSGEIKMVGDWRQGITDPLGMALATSVAVCGRTMAEACKHAIILMAQSAAALTPQAKRKRKIERDMRLHGAEYVTVHKKEGAQSRIYKFKFNPIEQARSGALKGTWEQAQNIANRGLAKRSWMWGLRGLGQPSVSRPIPGVAYVKSIISETHAGYILRDTLKYLIKILPAGWEQTVKQKAENKIMRQAKMKLEREWGSAMRRKQRAGAVIGRGIGQYFLRVA